MKTWFDELFNGMEPWKVMIAPEAYNHLPVGVQGHVMGAEKNTIESVPLIDFNPLPYAQEFERTAQSSVMDWDRRLKQVSVTVGGAGSGKARALTEIRTAQEG